MTSNINIVETAKSYLGKLTYVFGGNDIPNGRGDCSDFTEHVFAVHGFSIGTDTEAQYSKGRTVSRDNVAAGDLVFFKDTYDSKKTDGVSHVGIATSNDSFIHLSNSGCVHSSLNDNYWKKHYLGARRISGISYEDYAEDAPEEIPDTEENVSLVWWGDIVRVVVLIILIASGIGFLAFGVGKNILSKGAL